MAKPPLSGTAKIVIAITNITRKSIEGQSDIGNLLAEQEFQPRHRRDVKIGDRAELLFAHDGERHENGGNQRELERDGARNHGVDRVEILIVAEARLDRGRRRRPSPDTMPRMAGSDEELQVDALQIAVDRLGAERHRAVDPDRDLGLAAALDVAAEARRNFDRGADGAALQSGAQILGVADRRPVR